LLVVTVPLVRLPPVATIPPICSEISHRLASDAMLPLVVVWMYLPSISWIVADALAPAHPASGSVPLPALEAAAAVAVGEALALEVAAELAQLRKHCPTMKHGQSRKR
jgi:hypothetical protein